MLWAVYQDHDHPYWTVSGLLALRLGEKYTKMQLNQFTTHGIHFMEKLKFSIKMDGIWGSRTQLLEL